MFKCSRQKHLSMFVFSQDNYQRLRKTIRTNCNIYHIYKPNIFINDQTPYQDKESMDKRLIEFKKILQPSGMENITLSLLI